MTRNQGAYHSPQTIAERSSTPLYPLKSRDIQSSVPDWSPMRQFVCKLASRCNLNCDYCYIYQHVDQSWREQPRRMSLETAAQLGRRIREHAEKHSLPGVDVTLHGGEPLLAGIGYVEEWMKAVSSHCGQTQIQFQMQTNGTFFNEQALDLCLKWNVRVGLSMDGPRSTNDRHRVGFKGESSFDDTERAAKLLSSPKGQEIWSGFLAVIDLESDPLEVYRYFKSYSPRSIEFLLPLSNYESRPPGKTVEEFDNTPYADWLLAIFYEWFYERPQTISIRRFRDIIALLGNAKSASEEWGLHPIDFAVVESNGSIEAVDTLKTTYPGACYLGLNVFDNSFDDVLTSPMVLERQQRWARLCDTCRACPLVEVCGGGYFPHRYSSTNGFQNPSIYCTDLKKIIPEIRSAVLTMLADARSRVEFSGSHSSQ